MDNALSNVFGTKPTNAIYLPDAPYAVRFNCQAGQLAISETEFLGTNAEISVVKVSRHFGSLGRTRNVAWMQLFYVPAPSCKTLPANTVCVSYIKTRSLSALQQTVIRLVGEGVNPAEGIFGVGFQRHSNGDRNYASVKFDWRERKGKPELDQLEQIKAFVESGPQLIDLDGTRELMCVDGLPSLLVQQMVDTAKLEPNLTPHEVLQLLQAPQLPSA
ncbi:hypothetical protein H6F75_26065 [Nodosilinea sp. FACHB-131]|uniref:hypothetical protein n=1 Tax=Cyanophyceae TaxID=3028117 RepID=UPI001683BF32|nr:hypothetical protein [Nodosilinea sp. FACHB-131]MBD1876955.1 hypothetical protein [Nodosilinea sp. FACHB-131]